MSLQSATRIASIVLLGLSIYPAVGADIGRQSGNEFDLIGLNGEIKPQDVVTFRSAADSSAKAIVVLDSPGGAALAGIEMGKVIYRKKLPRSFPKTLCVLRLALSCGWPGTRG